MLQGFIIGLAYLMPIGMQNLFVMNTALTQARSRAFAVAFTVALFDVSLAVACFYGAGGIMAHSRLLKLLFLAVGSVVVLVMGLQLLRAKGTLQQGAEVDVPFWRAVATAGAVTWCNPQAIVDGTVLLGAFKATLAAEEALRFIGGVGGASVCWFVGLTAALSFGGVRLGSRGLLRINRICGAVIAFYGCKLGGDCLALLLAF